MQAFVKVVECFNLQQKVMSITSDNSSNVLKLMTDFETYTLEHSDEWRPFMASKQHVPCLAHVINLAVQAMLGKNGLGAEAPKDAESLDVEDDDDTEGFIRTTIMEEEDEDEDDTSESLEEDKVSTKHALQKLRKGIVKI
ncbi:hypothetical protein BG003_001180, partial [Podila horticola]